MKTKTKKSPDALVIVSVILLLTILLTWLVPAGAYDRAEVNGRSVVVGGTYQETSANPQSLWDAFKAPLRGFESAADIVGFVLLVGGAFALLMKTGAINALLFRVVRWSEKNKTVGVLTIPFVMSFFAFGGYTFGMSEETLVFILITIPLARSMGYDAIVGVSLAFLGAGVGFAGAAFNPFTIGVAHGIAEIPTFSGWGYRTVVCVVFTLVASLFVMQYARKVQKDPTKSLLHGKVKAIDEKVEDIPLTTSRVIVLLLFMISLGLVMLGALQWDWYITEISALFLALGIAAAVINRLGLSTSMKAFYSGVKDMLPAALIIALSKSILVVAEDGHIIDTVLFAMASLVDGLPRVVAVELMFFVQGAINFFIPSGSGQAAITMPVMTPLADILGISRQNAVLAYQFGDGLFNLIIPTSGVTMGVLSIAGIPYQIWMKWIWKLMVLLVLLAMVFLALPELGVVEFF